MAWRDSRGSRRRLLLYLLSMVLGVAALVAIHGFGANLQRTIAGEAQTILGADLELERRQPFSEEAAALVDSIGGEQARRISFTSMAYFPESEGTRLVSVRAMEEGYPFYGAIRTWPAGASQAYLEGANALLDGTLMKQFGVGIGDSVRIGQRSYRVAGEIRQTPRESAVFSLVSPRVFISMEDVDEELLEQGSRVEYEVFVKFGDGRDVDAFVEDVRPRLRKRGIGSLTASEAAEDWEAGLSDVRRFLGLVGFIALLLGSLGVASAVHVYVRRRIETVAVLRCLGAKIGSTFRVYLVQAAAMGLVGALLGCALGTGVQFLVPLVLADFLPVDVDFYLSWRALLLGMSIGLGVTMLFALLPLLRVRRVSPLLALRSEVEPSVASWRDPWRLVVFGMLAVGITGFALVQAPNAYVGLGYTAGVVVVFGLLALVARGLMAAAKAFMPASWPYPWRQGLANLYRPGNQTLVLTMVLGLCTFLILLLLLVQHTLLTQVERTGDGEARPNLVFFDVQSDELDGVADAIERAGGPVLARVPLVTMRLSEVGGSSVREMRSDSTQELSWAHNHEYRVTYRDELSASEEIVEGTFTGTAPESDEEAVPVSVAQEIVDEIGLSLGDSLTFSVQGVSIETVVGSIRKVDWQRMQTNFFVVFPTGVLEDMPKTFVVLSRAESDATSAHLQRAVVQEYPTVSAIDLSLVLSVLDALLNRVSFVIRFMALFSVGTGLLVLMGAVLSGRYQRAEESILLKTLGARQRQVFAVLCAEYLFLGLLAALTGVVLAVGGTWALASFVFDAPLALDPFPLLGALLVVPGLTLLIGLTSSRGLYAQPPMEVLRAEV